MLGGLEEKAVRLTMQTHFSFPLDFAASIVVFGQSGKTFIFRRLRGSPELNIKQIAQVTKSGWKLETICSREAALLVELNKTYEKYLYYRSEGYVLTADTWLRQADALAGRLSKLVDNRL